MRKLMLVMISLLSVGIIMAQNSQRGKITVNILGEGQQGLENATVELLKSKDSTLVKAAISGKAGLAELENIPLGSYVLRITMINYARQFSTPVSLTGER